ncbi:MAG: nucleoside-diphosphate sugar epimerase/dehydratase [Mariprofundus sp.]
MLVSDICALPFALWLAFSLRTGDLFAPDLSQLWLFVSALLIGIPIFVKMGLYRAIVHYMELKAFSTICKAVTLTVVIWGVILLLVDPHGVPRSSVVIFWMLALLMVAGSRLWMRWLLKSRSRKHLPRAVIYGAGASGRQLAYALRFSDRTQVAAFIDDDIELQGNDVAGHRVYGADDIEDLLNRECIEQVLIAMPAATARQKRQVLNSLEPYPVQVRILPSVEAIANGTVKLERLREVSVEDLLGRDAVAPDMLLLESCIRDKVVMVTGAGGSIGSELCRQIILHQPRALLLYERNELALYSIERELRQFLTDHYMEMELVALLGSVHHLNRAKKICVSFGVQTIYHAAAYKHVPLVECNPIEAIHNNIMGTLHMAQAALQTGVERFVLISTDKAVRPTNVMGATKRCAELVLQALNHSQAGTDTGSTCFSMVRFGNVLGSSGSVIPLFRDQIKRGGPLTLTHQKITRYFMTIPEAAQLVIQAGAMAEGGDVFVLDMGKPVRILDLAKKMIALSGLSVRDEQNPSGDIEIVETGLRPGEKLYEELLIGDNVEGTKHPLIMRASEEMIAWAELSPLLEQMQQASCEFDVGQIRELLQVTVSGYKPEANVHDILWNRQQVKKK